MANLNIHPAPGLGDLTAGYYVVPQNPIALATEGVSRVPTLGEFMMASFVVPQNPFFSYVAGQVAPLGQGIAGHHILRKGMSGLGGCGCGGSCGGCGGGECVGLGQLDFSSTTAFMTSLQTLATEDSLGLGLPNWGYAAVGLLGYMFLFGPSTGPSRVSRARRAYRSYATA